VQRDGRDGRDILSAAGAVGISARLPAAYTRIMSNSPVLRALHSQARRRQDQVETFETSPPTGQIFQFDRLQPIHSIEQPPAKW